MKLFILILFIILFKSERCFPAEHVLIFSWLQERSSAKNDVQTAVPSSCNERT